MKRKDKKRKARKLLFQGQAQTSFQAQHFRKVRYRFRGNKAQYRFRGRRSTFAMSGTGFKMQDR